MPHRPLTATMEDYLEAILNLEHEQKVARVKEIARRLDVKLPSVSGALKNLKSRELVNHEAYGYVTLTPRGRELARHVRARHEAIVNFLETILQLRAGEAETEACELEHALGADALHRLVMLTGFLQEHPGLYAEWLEHLEQGRPAEVLSVVPEAVPAAPMVTTLDRVPPGVVVRVRRVGGSGAIRRRLLDMGLRPGAEVKVARLAPLGDPVEIHVLDYHLSVRKVEAAGIEVEIIALPLAMVQPGATVIMDHALGRGLLEQLAAEGLTPGRSLTVVEGLGNTGGMRVRADDHELAVGRGQANRVIVRPSSPAQAPAGDDEQ